MIIFFSPVAYVFDYPACPGKFTENDLFSVFEKAVFGNEMRSGFRREMLPAGHLRTYRYGVDISNPYYSHARDAAVKLFYIYHYRYFDTITVNSKVSYLGQVLQVNKQGLPKERGTSLWAESEEYKSLLNTEVSDYQCVYRVFDQLGPKKDREILSTMHWVPEGLDGDERNLIKVWACVEKSMLYFMGYKNINTVSDELLISRVPNSNYYRPTELFGWLVRLVFDSPFDISSDKSKHEIMASLKKFQSERCEE